jgi:hypothetical protein
VQVAGGAAGRGGLGGVVLGGSPLGYGIDERGEAQNQGGDRQGAGTLAEGTEEPRTVAELVAGAGTGRDPAVRSTGGAVVGVGGAAELAAAEHPGGDVERVGDGPGGVVGAGRVDRGAVPDVIRCCSRPAGRVLPGGAAVGQSDPCRDGASGQRSGVRVPAAAEPGEGQVGGELAAAEPDRSPAAGCMVRQGDGLAGDLAGSPCALAVADQDAGVAEPSKELLLRARGGRSGTDLSAQGDAGWLGPAVPGSLLRLGARGPLGGGAIRWGGPLEAEAALGGLAGGTDLEEVVPGARPCAVLAGQGGDDVDVVRGVPDCRPPHGLEVVRGRETCSVHDLVGDCGPLGVGQGPVPWRGPNGAVPDGPVAGRPPGRERLE